MSERDPAKGAAYADVIKRFTLQELIDLVCLKATLENTNVRIKVTPGRPKDLKARAPRSRVE